MTDIVLNVARRYAAEHKCDIIRPSVEHNGMSYFLVDYTGRARYTGHPHIIKISSTGIVERVMDFDEIYWAYNQVKGTLN